MSQPVPESQSDATAPAPKPLEDTLTMSLDDLRALLD
ncbi:hypothetical protein JOF53_000887 [Crossiella equi]|uniref:Uncharacterized protein n=1 Tax=Crossiella equi TaxID=130796 RepID=A0ABS5A8I5_9PSEU|nr:hypothetical protein [Crossiella equi]